MRLDNKKTHLNLLDAGETKEAEGAIANILNRVETLAVDIRRGGKKVRPGGYIVRVRERGGEGRSVCSV